MKSKLTQFKQTHQNLRTFLSRRKNPIKYLNSSAQNIQEIFTDEFWGDCKFSDGERDLGWDAKLDSVSQHKTGIKNSKLELNTNFKYEENIKTKAIKNNSITKSRNILESKLRQSLSLPGKDSFSKSSKINHYNSFCDKNVEKYEFSKKGRVDSQDRCLILYEKGKIKNEFLRLSQQNPKNLQEEIELKECTFYPKTNNLMNKKYSSASFDSSIYERTTNWKKMNQEKYRKNRKEEE